MEGAGGGTSGCCDRVVKEICYREPRVLTLGGGKGGVKAQQTQQGDVVQHREAADGKGRGTGQGC
jgi:hypothetical protein